MGVVVYSKYDVEYKDDSIRFVKWQHSYQAVHTLFFIHDFTQK